MEGGKVGGQSLNDRRLAARVRSLALKKVEEILAMTEMNFEEREFQKAVLLKLAGTILPRLNEHTGEDGEKLFPQPLLAGKSNVPDNNRNNETPSTEETN